jgi:hypothetical protein
MAHDVFVSYSSKDKTIADAIVAALENNHIRCWVAPRDVKPGEDWAKAISNAIQESKVFLVIFSGNSNRSQRVLDEINFAISQELTILPFRIENLEPDGAMRLHLSSRHWLDAYDPSWEKHLSKLTKTITSILEKSTVEVESGIPGTRLKHGQKQRLNMLARILVGIAMVAFLVGAGWYGVSTLNKKAQVIPGTAGNAIPWVATPTLESVSTPTPETLPQVLKVFSEPILAAVQDLPPDFEDDFSQIKSGWEARPYDPVSNSWGCLNTNMEDVKMEITNGIMKIKGKSGCPITQVLNPNSKYANFLLQVDVNLHDLDTMLSVIWNRVDGGLPSNHSEFQFNGYGWSLSTVRAQGIWVERKSGQVSIDTSKPVTLTFIYKNNVSIIYLDAVPHLYYYDKNDIEAVPSEDILMFMAAFVFDGTSIPLQTLDLDNMKVWDLGKIEGLPIMAVNPENGHQYLYMEENQTWQQARQYCQSIGGYLAAIETPAENSFVFHLTGGVTWLGATDEAKEGFWAWAAGQPLDYQNFAKGEPDHQGASYVSFYIDAATGEIFETWKDGPGDVKMPFVCEWDVTGQE